MSDLPQLLAASIDRRAPLLARLDQEATDCVRLLHGATEGAPGVAVDRYGPVLLVQTWREPLADGTTDALLGIAREVVPVERVVWNHRPRGGPGWRPVDAPVVGRELGLLFDVRPRHRGRDPLLFLDLRAGRRWIRSVARDRTVLNLFAYTCGVGLAASAGGAGAVTNVDFAQSALDVGRANEAANGLTGQEYIAEDVFPVLRQMAGLRMRDRRGGRRATFTRREPRTFDVVVLDPPRWATGKHGAVDLVRDYQSLLKPALLATAPGGQLLITNNVASVDRDVWRSLCLRCADKAGRPVADWTWLPPEDDFPSPDGQPPLKMAILTLENAT